jgi:ACS family allantoate permease-like MFS transporter
MAVSPSSSRVRLVTGKPQTLDVASSYPLIIFPSIGFLGGEKWRWFFWITGIITIVWACIAGLFLPDNPISAKFISERERAIAVNRVRANQTGIENKTFKTEQMIEAFLDPKTWLMFFFVVFIAIPNGGLTNVSISSLEVFVHTSAPY